MTDPTAIDDDYSTQVSPGRRVLGWLGAVALVFIVVVLFMHVFAPPISLDEPPPSDHPRSACIACHMVTGSAEGDEVR